MDPVIWGPHLWVFLHSMSFAYGKNRLAPTDDEKKGMYQFLQSLQYVLPCVCKFNYARHFKKSPPRLDTRKDLFQWLVELHNTVNLDYNKKMIKQNISFTPKKLYTYEEVEQMYKKMYNQA